MERFILFCLVVLGSCEVQGRFCYFFNLFIFLNLAFPADIELYLD